MVEYYVFEQITNNGTTVQILPGDRFSLRLSGDTLLFEEIGFSDQPVRYSTPASSFCYAAKDLIIAFTKAKELRDNLRSKGVLLRE